MKVVNRIKQSREFASTIKKGKLFKNSSFIVYKNYNSLSKTRVGISVSKKLGNAVVRNKTKRQLRSICDSLINYSENFFDIVIIVRQNFLNKTFQENKELLSQLLSSM